MKNKKDTLKILRLHSNKIYVGEFQGQQCSGYSIVVFKNGNIYEGMMQANKREGKGFYLQAGTGWYEGVFSNDLKAETGI